MRIDKIRILTGILFLILIGGVFYLQIVKGGFYYSLSVKNCIRVMPLEGIRGRIMDSSGRVLVDNQMSYNIAVIPYELKKNPKTISELAGLLNKSVPRIKRKLRKALFLHSARLLSSKTRIRKQLYLLKRTNSGFPELRYGYYLNANTLIMTWPAM